MTSATNWIIDRVPTENDATAGQYWCVIVTDVFGDEYAMRWDDLELQEFITKKTSVVAWKQFGLKGGAA